MRKIFSLFAALTLSVGLFAQNNVIKYTATRDMGFLLEGPYYGEAKLTKHTYDAQTGEGVATYDIDVVEIGYTGLSAPYFTTLDIPASVTTLGQNACKGKNITRITFGEGSKLQQIGMGAFDGCESLAEFTMPSSVISIGMYAFRDCISLKSIHIPATTKVIGASAFISCKNLETVTIAPTAQIKNIEDGTFCACPKLANFEIPSSVISIGNDAFAKDSALVRLDIPASVKNIGSSAFENCAKLQEVQVNWVTEDELPTVGSDIFEDIDDNSVLLVPAAAQEMYETSSKCLWRSYFKEIQGNLPLEYTISVIVPNYSIGSCYLVGEWCDMGGQPIRMTQSRTEENTYTCSITMENSFDLTGFDVMDLMNMTYKYVHDEPMMENFYEDAIDGTDAPVRRLVKSVIKDVVAHWKDQPVIIDVETKDTAMAVFGSFIEDIERLPYKHSFATGEEASFVQAGFVNTYLNQVDKASGTIQSSVLIKTDTIYYGAQTESVVLTKDNNSVLLVEGATNMVSFTASETGDYGFDVAEDGKFVVTWPGQEATLPFVESEKTKANKFFHNGQLFLRQGDKTYTILGQGIIVP